MSYEYDILTELDKYLDESITVLIKPKFQKPFVLSIIYRPQYSPVSQRENFQSYVEQCYQMSDEVLILGDFNVNLSDNHAKKAWFSKVLSPLSLEQLINDNTRVTDTSHTLIDHIYTNKPSNYKNNSVLRLSLSDHYLIVTTRKLGVHRPRGRFKISFTDYSLMNDENLCRAFQGHKWHDLLCIPSIDVMFDDFYKRFFSIISPLIINRTKYVKSEKLPDWLDAEVQTNMRERDQLKSEGRWTEYKAKRNFVTNMIRKKKKKFIEKTVKMSKSTDTKKLWKTLNVKSSNISNASRHSSLTSEQLNSHFVSIADSLTNGGPGKFSSEDFNLNCNLPSISSTFQKLNKFTPAICYKYLNKMSDHKASGPDDISVKMLKKAFPYIKEIIVDMFNRVLSEGHYPLCWKLGKVTPIFKSGDISNPCNYRPITLLPVLSKIFEKHLNSELMDYLNKNKILCDLQAGFRSNHSCTDIVHKIIHDCLDDKAKGKVVAMLFLDFRKAFDCVDHSILKKKLCYYGIRNDVLKLICSYLQGRQQYVCFNGEKSTLLEIKRGVPQGSVIAPTLFLLFINDLLESILFCKSYAYADDTIFVGSSHNLQQLEIKCNEDLSYINEWCNKNGMVINHNKSHFLLVNSTKSIKLYVDGEELQKKSSTKLLGFLINDKLNWSDHVDSLYEKVRRNINLFRMIRVFLNKKTALLFYFHFIFCHLNFGIHMYFNFSPNYITNPLLILQKQCFRIIANVHYIPRHLISSSDLYNSLQLLPLHQLASYSTSLFGYKILHKKCPEFIHADFNVHTHRFPIRDIFLLRGNENFFHRNILRTFNSLPYDIRSAKSLSSFKDKLFKFLS